MNPDHALRRTPHHRQCVGCGCWIVQQATGSVWKAAAVPSVCWAEGLTSRRHASSHFLSSWPRGNLCPAGSRTQLSSSRHTRPCKAFLRPFIWSLLLTQYSPTNTSTASTRTASQAACIVQSQLRSTPGLPAWLGEWDLRQHVTHGLTPVQGPCSTDDAAHDHQNAQPAQHAAHSQPANPALPAFIAAVITLTLPTPYSSPNP